MKSRYTLFLSHTITDDANVVEVTFPVDLRTVIPREKVQSKFILKSSFSSDAWGSLELGGVEIGIGLSQAFNSSYPQQKYLKIGIAEPVVCESDIDVNTRFKYKYSEGECVPLMVDYPEVYPVTIELKVKGVDDIPAGVQFSLHLAFEEI